MIVFFPDGSYSLKKSLCDCGSCLLGNFNECHVSGDIDVPLDPAFVEEVMELDETDNMVIRDSYTFTEEGTYAALYSSTHFELFYLVHVVKKSIAEESKSDVYRHFVQEGECYLEANYLEKVKETNKKVYYKNN